MQAAAMAPVKKNKQVEFAYFESEEIGTVMPARCLNCAGCEVCSVRAQTMTVREAVELQEIEARVKYDPELKRVTGSYPFGRSPDILEDNFVQAVRIAIGVEKILRKTNRLHEYNEVIRDMIRRGALRILPKEERDAWTGPLNYVSHHGVEKTDSLSTPLRIVSNSSLDNNNKGHSYNS